MYPKKNKSVLKCNHSSLRILTKYCNVTLPIYVYTIESRRKNKGLKLASAFVINCLLPFCICQDTTKDNPDKQTICCSCAWTIFFHSVDSEFFFKFCDVAEVVNHP